MLSSSCLEMTKNPRPLMKGGDFQSAALPTELPGRAMQQNNLADRLGRWECHCLPLRSAIIHLSNPSSPPMRTAFSLAATALAVTSLVAQEPYRPPVVGRWDLTLTASDDRKLPSWLEVRVSGNHVLVGRFVAGVGSVRPISKLDYANDTLRFAIPSQWEQGSDELRLEAGVGGGRPSGGPGVPPGARPPPGGGGAPGRPRHTPPRGGTPGGGLP